MLIGTSSQFEFAEKVGDRLKIFDTEESQGAKQLVVGSASALITALASTLQMLFSEKVMIIYVYIFLFI